MLLRSAICTPCDAMVACKRHAPRASIGPVMRVSAHRHRSLVAAAREACPSAEPGPSCPISIVGVHSESRHAAQWSPW
eukprot:5153631-Alexandrium_andersonii.AAC.1